jgi:predicted DCC family thiol-disulfide oxidoreductase YuxK
MRELTVLYDASCAVCRDARSWLEAQPKFARLRFVAAGSSAAAVMFPRLNHAETLREITVVDEAGQVYRGAKAWAMCLWATRAYRAWSLTLTSPELWPMAKRMIAWVSRNRGQLAEPGRWALRRLN